MPYSTDSDDNRINPVTPSGNFSFENQIIYRLASLEATVTNSLKRIDEKIDRFQSDANQKYTTNAADIARVAATLEAHKESTTRAVEKTKEDLDARLAPLEKWKTESLAKISLIAGAIALAWAVFGNAIANVFKASI